MAVGSDPYTTGGTALCDWHQDALRLLEALHFNFSQHFAGSLYFASDSNFGCNSDHDHDDGERRQNMQESDDESASKE